jgi:hypothetical protein
MNCLKLVWLAVCVAACSADGKPSKDSTPEAAASTKPAFATPPADTTPPRDLAATRWRLVEIQSMDDKQGTTRPPDPAKYNVAFDSEGGFLVMQLDCMRATGPYEDKRGSDRSGGEITIGPLKVEPASCPKPSVADRVARDMGYVRSYRLVNGRPALALMADGGIYVWERTQ